ncbi:9754_t:CDS:2, partial [Racocetra persica]
KYRKKLQSIQLEIAKTKNPLINDKDISLLVLYETIKKLQKDLAKNKKRDVRNCNKTLEKLLLNDNNLLEIQELVKLLSPFAHVTTI